ncbi:hypothetical protein [Gloeocapsa sp. PCC 73106]|uniref:hypothetical protein n=1 Tax=Gloeocapsa sp. PCC 73106 TaxID=102232 RepID=UPI0002AC968B|nr:hypothetical protein [Gloeocapsa sp. PCC 73106]ELR98227.1 hypothetical protein GLO73106DRAFT_00020540 [Gloeocapsa sp. PCC 73106]
MSKKTFNIKVPEKRKDWQKQQGLYFMIAGDIWESINQLNRNLKSKKIDYCLVESIALNLHGYERLTTDVDILMDGENLARFTRELIGLGYRPAFLGAKKTFYDTKKTRIEILVTREYPGDGKPKPISFPNPTEVLTEIDSLPVINLEKLIEMKLASGISNPGRFKDLGDVQEMIKVLDLPLDFMESLSPYVQDKYMELWSGASLDTYQSEQRKSIDLDR